MSKECSQCNCSQVLLGNIALHSLLSQEREYVQNQPKCSPNLNFRRCVSDLKSSTFARLQSTFARLQNTFAKLQSSFARFWSRIFHTSMKPRHEHAKDNVLWCWIARKKYSVQSSFALAYEAKSALAWFLNWNSLKHAPQLGCTRSAGKGGLLRVNDRSGTVGMPFAFAWSCRVQHAPKSDWSLIQNGQAWLASFFKYTI